MWWCNPSNCIRTQGLPAAGPLAAGPSVAGRTVQASTMVTKAIYCSNRLQTQQQSKAAEGKDHGAATVLTKTCDSQPPHNVRRPPAVYGIAASALPLLTPKL